MKLTGMSRLQKWLPEFVLNYFCIFLFIFLGSSSIPGQTVDPFTQVTNDNFANYDVVMHDDYIVYRHTNIANDNGIFLYKISTGEVTTVISETQGAYLDIDMWGDRIVWQQYNGEDWDIYTYLISRPDIGAYALIDHDGDQYSPAIYEDILVWSDHREDFISHIHMYDISSGVETVVTSHDFGSASLPDVYGNYIVYVFFDDIYMYDIYRDEIIPITDDDVEQRNPCIWKNRIVWEDKRNFNWDLYMHVINFYPDVDPVDFHQPIYTGAGIGYLNNFDQINPQINDNYIVYQSNQSFHWDIYLYTFINPLVGTTRSIVDEMRFQFEPTLWGSKVAWLDERDYTGTGLYRNDVWMWEKPEGIDLAVGIYSEPEPAALGEQLDFLTLVKNLGDQTSYEPVLTFTLPPDVEFLSMDGFGSQGYTRVGDELYCRLDSLEGSETDTIIISVRTLKERILTVTAEIDLDFSEEDTDLDNNWVSYDASVVWVIPTLVGEGGNPSVAVDGNGRPHFCYLSSPWEGQLIYATVANGRVKNTIIDSSYYTYSASIAVDKNNHVHIAFSQYDGVEPNQKALYYMNNTFGVWSEPEMITSNAGDGEAVCLKLGKNDSLHVSFMSSLWSMGSTQYFVRDEGVWDKRFTRTASYNFAAFDLDSADHAHFVYYDLSSSGLLYQTNSPDGVFGAYLPPDVNWTGAQMETLVADIVLDDDSQPHISYVGQTSGSGTEDYRYAYRDDQGWHTKKIDDGAFAGSDNCIDLDPADNPHISYYNPANERLYYSWEENNIWQYKIVDFFSYPPTQNHDLDIDQNGFSHIIYNKGNMVYYVSNSVPIPEPEISVDPTGLTFHDFVVGDTTDAKKVVITNVGEADLIINDVRIGWRDSSSFSLGNVTCGLLHPADTCSIEVMFNPSVLGPKTAMLWIESNDPVFPVKGVTLNGGGLEGLLANIGFQEFGAVNSGDSAVHEYKLKNLGNYQLTVQGIYLENGDTDDFYYSDFPEVPFNLDEGDSVSYNVVFKPLSEGAKSVLLKIYSTGGSPVAELSGYGRPPGYSIEGSVQLSDGTPVTAGNIVLLKMDDNPHWVLYKPLDGNSDFIFPSWPEMDVSLRFDPAPLVYPDLIRTYYGDTPFEYEATVWHHDSDDDGLVINVLEAPDEGSGSSDVDGSVVEDGGKKAGLTLRSGKDAVEGTPLDSVPVYLTSLDGEIMHADVSDENGAFAFTQVDMGEYLLSLDYNSCKMAEGSDTLKVSGENEEFTVTAVISEGSFHASFTKSTGVQDLSLKQRVRVYPNPFKESFIIEISGGGSSMLGYSIVDLCGRCVLKGQEYSEGGVLQVEIDAGRLVKGSYFLRLDCGESIWMGKLIHQ